MTALAQNSTYYTHPTGNPTRRGGSLILRNVHLFCGALALFHDDMVAASSRLMPARSLNNANTPAQGGPLQIAGADANGGLRVISRIPNVKLIINTSGSGSAASVQVIYPTSPPLVTVTVLIGSATIAATVVLALQAVPFLDSAATGTGTSAAGVTGAAFIPYVRPAGFVKKEFANDGAVTDLAVSDIIELDTGLCFMANDATDPASASDAGGMVSLLDDQTIARTQVPLQIPVFLHDWQPVHAGASGPCIRIP